MLKISDFKGQMSNFDPSGVPPGGAIAQMNVSTTKSGALAVRKGSQPATFTSTATISSSNFSTFQPLCFCKTRFGDLIGVNGVNRGFRWDGMTTNIEQLGIDAPTVAPTVAGASGGAATAGDYLCAYRYIDDTLPDPIPSSLSPTTTVTATANQKFSWSNIPGTLPGRATRVELWRTVSGGTNVFYKITTLNAGTTTYSTDTSSDATLNASSEENTLLLLLEDGELNARRFVPPPNDRCFVKMFQDRYWYFGHVRYNTGTVSPDGDTSLTGSGTGWVSTLADRYILIDGEPAPIKISSVGSATALTLATAATTTASGKSYVIIPDPTTRRTLFYSEADEPESVSTTNTVTIQENTGDDDEITGGMPRGSFLYILFERHKYAISFVRQPRIDASVTLIDDRGAFNDRCWAYLDDVGFLMDDEGPYAFDGSRSIPIGANIQNLWRKDVGGDRIDFTKKAKFHVSVDRAKERIHFWVAFVGDTGSYPTRCLTYNARRQTWDPYEMPIAIAASTAADVSGQTRMCLGGETSTVYLADAGNTEIITSEIRGTATSTSSTTLTDSGASFTSAVLGAFVYIYDGTGKGQRRKITAQTSTQLTVATWDTTPDTTSKYIVGAIPWSWKSGQFRLEESERQNLRRVEINFEPTTSEVPMDLRLYFNADSTARSHAAEQRRGDAVKITYEQPKDVVFNMKNTASDLENSTGSEFHDFSGRSGACGHVDRWVSLELRGFQGDDAVSLADILLDGVKE